MSQTQTIALNPHNADLSVSGIKRILGQPGMTKKDVKKAKKMIKDIQRQQNH